MLIIHRNSQIFTWARLGWCPVGSGAEWSSPWPEQSCALWADPALHRVWLEEVRGGKAPASSTNPAVEFMNPKYTPLEAGEGIRILVMLGLDLFRLWKLRDNQGTGVWVTNWSVTSWIWSLFTSATKWLPWLHLHIHLIIEIDSQSSVELTQRPRWEE